MGRGRMKIFQVDSFSNRLFAGNPAGVCLLDAPVPDAWMQAVAREMNLSETAFVLPEKEGFRLRWFTPAVEVDLCGHATLASAHTLWEQGILAASEPALFFTRSGRLICTRRGDWIWMDFPAQPAAAADLPADLLPALGIERALFTGRNVRDAFIEVDDENIVRELAPDFASLRAGGVPGVIVTARSRSVEHDFISRFFAPLLGVDEDPVTGSAHTALAPYWAEKLGKDSLRAYQASARGGELLLTCAGERVLIGGQAVTVLRGEMDA